VNTRREQRLTRLIPPQSAIVSSAENQLYGFVSFYRTHIYNNNSGNSSRGGQSRRALLLLLNK